MTYMWRRRGTPRTIPTPGKNTRVAVCGAYRWPDGPFVFSHGQKSVNTARFVELVTRLAQRARRTGRRILLVIDNGSAHTSRHSREVLAQFEDLIRVVWLPTYSSEQLNDIEALWKRLKEDYFGRMLVRTAQDFEAAVVQLLDRFRAPGAVRRFLRARLPGGGCINFVKVA